MLYHSSVQKTLIVIVVLGIAWQMMSESKVDYKTYSTQGAASLMTEELGQAVAEYFLQCYEVGCLVTMRKPFKLVGSLWWPYLGARCPS